MFIATTNNTIRSMMMRRAATNTTRSHHHIMMNTSIITRKNLSSTINNHIARNPFFATTCIRSASSPAAIDIAHDAPPPPRRMSFSSDSKSDDEDPPPLAETIAREIDQEKDAGNSMMPDSLSELNTKLSTTWRIVVGNDDSAPSSSANVKLYRNKPMKGGGKVSIHFHCQDTIDMNEENSMFDNMFGNSDDDQTQEENEAQDEIPAGTRFELYVSRLGKTMKLSCTSADAKVTVDAVVAFEGGVADENKGGDDADAYNGPLFEELPEDMQGGFTHFATEDCGVNEDVAAFISMYADYQEQVEYIRWLHDVKKIIAS